jgi:hypothetical protein
VWVAGVAALFLVGLTRAMGPGGSAGLTPERIAASLTFVVVNLGLAFVVRWVWVSLRGGGRVLSPWVLAIAAVFVGAGSLAALVR